MSVNSSYLLPLVNSTSNVRSGLVRSKSDPNKLLRQGIWLYFLLIIFEGALRKWFLPALATPLLIVRDPIAIWLILLAWRRNLLPSTIYSAALVLIGILGIFTAIFIGHGNLAVALFGARIFLIHVPFLFVIGRVFTRDNVIQLGKVTVMMAVPMALLIGIQFYSPQSAWVNLGVGGDTAGAGFDGAMGYFRPPATFSFTTGTTSFFSFAAVYIFYFWLNPKYISRLILILATISLVAAVPLSMSRSLVSNLAISVVFIGVALMHEPKYVGKILPISILLVIALVFFNQLSFFQTATKAFSTRFETATEVEGGLEGTSGRFIGSMLQPLEESSQQPFFGYGIGIGTNVGTMLLTGGKGFLISEGEWGRLIGELGPLMGLTAIILRISLVFKIGVASYRRLAFGDFLPWLLLSFGMLIIAQGQWAQPTTLGFSTMIAGLIIASFRIPQVKHK